MVLHPDQDRRSVSPDLGPNRLQLFSADDKIRRGQGKSSPIGDWWILPSRLMQYSLAVIYFLRRQNFNLIIMLLFFHFCIFFFFLLNCVDPDEMPLSA